jgi:Zn-dependent M28 family amino/carboxypeptidase
MNWIGATFTSRTGWNHLERLVDIGDRMAGSDGEREAALATRDALAEHARNAHLTEFPVQGWTRGDSHIDAGDTRQESIALPRSPAGEVTGELVDLGYGLPEDFEADLEGKVVMCSSDVPSWYGRFIHRSEKYYHAVEAGAAAFVFRNHIAGCLAPTGSVGAPDAPIGDIPAVGVSKEVGARLARRFEGRDVTVAVDCEIDDATSQNVHAELGPDTDEVVLVTSHVDAHDIAEGAMDNGAGTAMVVELAKALAAREDDLDTKVRFTCFGAEEVGLVGAAWQAEQDDLDGVKAVVNCDGVLRGRDLVFTTHGFDALGEAVRAVGERFDHPLEVVPELGPHSDHWEYTKWGVPAVWVHSTDRQSGRGWGHTRADTLDKLQSRDLREGAVLLTDLVVEVADAGREIPHKDTDELIERLEAEDLAAGMKITGNWPY